VSLAAPLLALSALLSPARAAAQGPPAEVVVNAATLRTLEARLQPFAASLTPEEKEAWTGLLYRAAAAPADDPAGTQVRPLFYRPAGRTAAAGMPAGDGRVIRQRPEGAQAPVIVQEGRPSGEQGQGGGPGQTLMVPSGTTPQLGQGGRTVMLGSGNGPARTTGSVIMRLRAASTGFPDAERATIDWMLQRAFATAPAAPGTLPPGPCSLAQALGITPLASGSTQAPAPPPEDTRWVLKF
jgi:hypothetical protein